MLLAFSSSRSRSRADNLKLGAAIILLAAAGLVGWSYLGADSGVEQSFDRGFKCNACGHEYVHVITSGEIEPVKCPACGKQAAYQAEKCYWTKGPNGEWIAKAKPTLVLLKTHVDPESSERTICPDCGHEVVGHNPTPSQALMEAARKRNEGN